MESRLEVTIGLAVTVSQLGYAYFFLHSHMVRDMQWAIIEHVRP